MEGSRNNIEGKTQDSISRKEEINNWHVESNKRTKDYAQA